VGAVSTCPWVDRIASSSVTAVDTQYAYSSASEHQILVVLSVDFAYEQCCGY
jgi:hypothetical protein